MSLFCTLVFSVLAAGAYFYVSESTIPKNTNCSYLASPWTDVGAFIGGLILLFKGCQYGDNVIVFVGGTIFTIHLLQYMTHKSNHEISTGWETDLANDGVQGSP